MTSALRRPLDATAFVDWNSQIHVKPKRTLDGDEHQIAALTLTYVTRCVCKFLLSASPENNFNVTLRFYHGWRKGFAATDRKKALISLVSGADFPAMSSARNVSFRPEIEFGDNLISGSTSRFHGNIDCHLPNTLRRKIGAIDTWEEKMVDTAIASDVVDVAHRELNRWIIVLGEDDDLVPPVYVAEGIRGPKGGRVGLIRNRPHGPFLILNGIAFKP